MPLKFQRQGIRYDELSDDEKKTSGTRWVGRGRWRSARRGERRGGEPVAVQHRHGGQNAGPADAARAKVAGGDRLGKTIVFAKNQRHAEFIQERFDVNYPEYRGEFARTITFKTEYAQSLIDAFSQKTARRTSRFR